MPFLDVSDVVMDPDLADGFNIIRRAETLVAGRSVITESPMNGLIGVITQQDPRELMRRDDSQSVPRSIFVASTFAFRDASKGFQPDIIVWPLNPDGTPAADSARYTIKQVYPYSRYGRGIFECVALSMNATDEAIT